MDAVEYLKMRRRMCDNNSDCDACPLVSYNDGEPRTYGSCAKFEEEHPEQIVEIVEKWAAEHPIKTRQSELMKLFPNLERDVFGMCILCPRHFDTKFECVRFSNCQECCENYWLEEIEEG